jgi:hypothetical protein
MTLTQGKCREGAARDEQVALFVQSTGFYQPGGFPEEKKGGRTGEQE